MVRLYSILAAVLVVGTLGFLGWLVWADRNADQFAQCRGSVVAGGAGALGGPFTMIDHTGRSITDTELVTEPTILYFGYTFCPDVCPLDSARNAEAVEILDARGIRATPVFATIDPARDTVDVLSEFVSIFHPRMIGLTGSEAQVRTAAQAYRVYYAAQPAEDEFYLVDHSTHSYLLLPGHGFVDFLPRSLTPDQLADRVQCYAERM